MAFGIRVPNQNISRGVHGTGPPYYRSFKDIEEVLVPVKESIVHPRFMELTAPSDVAFDCLWRSNCSTCQLCDFATRPVSSYLATQNRTHHPPRPRQRGIERDELHLHITTFWPNFTTLLFRRLPVQQKTNTSSLSSSSLRWTRLGLRPVP